MLLPMHRPLRLSLAVAVSLGIVGAAAAAASLVHDPTRLPVGDGKVTTAGPKRGYVYSCQSSFRGGPAVHSGEWIRSDGTWDSTAKPAVSGSVSWPSSFSVGVTGGGVRISGNDLPKHATGTFPVSTSDPAYRYDPNPNPIRAQSLSFALPASPKVAASAACLPQGPIGVMLTGSFLFNALDAAGRDGVAHEVQDACGGHPEMRGAYHYHALSPCASDTKKGHSALAGYALDGFGIYGPRGENGKTLTNADLDACRGHTHAVAFNGKTARVYHYHATAEYPYTLGCFRGTPVR